MNYFFGKNTKSIFSVVLLVLLFSSCPSGPRYGDDPPGTPEHEKVDEKYTKKKATGAASGALFWAVKHGDINGVKEALGKNADPNVSDNLGRSALMWACWNGMPDIVEALISNSKISINQASKSTENGESNKYTALLCAAEVGRPDIFKLLTSKGADISLADKNKQTILHKAVNSGKIDMVEYILNLDIGQKKLYKDKDTYLNSQDINGFTPLHRAVIAGDSSIVKLLLDNNADAFQPAKKDGYKIYPLYSAFNYNDYHYIYIPLLEKLSLEQFNEILLYYTVTILENLRKNIKDIHREDDFGIIKTALDNIEIFISAEKNFPDSYPYIFSASQKRKGIQALVYEKFLRDASVYFEAIKKDDRDTFEELHGIIGRNLVNHGHESQEAILYAIQNKDNKIVSTLLGEGFRTLYNKDALAFAASVAMEKDAKSYEILDYMLRNIYAYGGRLYSRTGTYEGETALSYILQNNHYLAEKGWEEIIRIFNSLWSSQDINNREQIIYYIIKLKTDNSNKQIENKLIEIKENLFAFVFNKEINQNSARYETKDPKKKYIKEQILVFLLQEKFYYGFNLLLLEPKFKTKILSKEILDQIVNLLPSINEINGERLQELKNFIQEVKPDNTKSTMIDNKTYLGRK